MIMEPREVWDRATILKIRCEKGLGQEKELEPYLLELEDAVHSELFMRLYEVNKRIWELEEQISGIAFSQDDDELMRLHLMWKRVLETREANTERTMIKNEISQSFGGNTEVKKFYASNLCDNV